MPVGWVLNRFEPVKGATPYKLVYGKSHKGLLAEYGVILGNGWEARHLCAYRWGAGSAQRVRQKNRSRLVQIFTHPQKFQCLFIGVQANFGGRIIATNRRAEALPAAQTDSPQEHVTLNFRDEDAEAVMAKSA